MLSRLRIPAHWSLLRSTVRGHWTSQRQVVLTCRSRAAGRADRSARCRPAGAIGVGTPRPLSVPHDT